MQVYLFDGNGSAAVGTNDMGWIINETKHTNGTTIKYKFDDNTNGGFLSTQKSTISAGFALWNTSPINISQDTTNAVGTVINNPNLGSSVFALLVTSTNSSGHITSWNLQVNTSKTITGVKMAHEMGHIIGLRDLSTTSNKSKIMYQNDSRTATTPHAQDLWGAKIIMGNHASHTWTYVYHSVNKHRKLCTACGGYKTEACTPNANGYCTKCGHYVDISPDGNYDPTAALLPELEDGRRSFPRQ